MSDDEPQGELARLRGAIGEIGRGWMKYVPVSPMHRFVWLGSIAFLLMSLTSGYLTVPSDSEGVIQRFGKYHRTVGPGLHLKIPWGVDHATILPVKRQLKQEFGFATPGSQNSNQNATPHEANLERQMVTGDLNAALVEWVVQYRISSPMRFLLEVRRPDERTSTRPNRCKPPSTRSTKLNKKRKN